MDFLRNSSSQQDRLVIVSDSWEDTYGDNDTFRNENILKLAGFLVSCGGSTVQSWVVIAITQASLLPSRGS